MRQGGPERITRLAIFGEDFWVNHLASGLTERYGERLVVEAFPSATHSAGSIRVFCALLRSDVTLSVGLLEQVIQPYAPVTGPQESAVRALAKRILFDTRVGLAMRALVIRTRFWFAENSASRYAWLIAMSRRMRPKRADFMYWIGSDVTLALQRHEETPRLTRRWTCPDAPHSLTVAQHLADELLTIGVHSVVRPFPKPLPGGPIPSLPPRLTVLAYLPSSRFAFYGGTTVLEAARRLQDVEFLIIGGAMPAGEQAYDNVTVLGMQSDMYAVYERATVLVRLTEHDGCPSTVAEALSLGRYVIHSYERPYCIHVAHGDTESLVVALLQLQALHDAGSLTPQLEAAEWARHEYDPDTRFNELLQTLVGGYEE